MTWNENILLMRFKEKKRDFACLRCRIRSNRIMILLPDHIIIINSGGRRRNFWRVITKFFAFSSLTWSYKLFLPFLILILWANLLFAIIPSYLYDWGTKQLNTGLRWKSLALLSSRLWLICILNFKFSQECEYRFVNGKKNWIGKVKQTQYK